MAMLLDLPKLPRDVVDRIRTYMYGPQIPAFLARYGNRITAHVQNAHPFTPGIDTCSPYDCHRLFWGVGLGRFYRRFLWFVPQHAFRYLTRGMPVIIRFGWRYMSMYTVVEMRRSSLLVSVGPCEIEIPTTLIIELAIYVEIPHAVCNGRTRGKPWLCPNDDEYELDLNEQEAIKHEQDVQFHYQCGLIHSDTDTITRARYNVLCGYHSG